MKYLKFGVIIADRFENEPKRTEIVLIKESDVDDFGFNPEKYVDNFNIDIDGVLDIIELS